MTVVPSRDRNLSVQTPPVTREHQISTGTHAQISRDTRKLELNPSSILPWHGIPTLRHSRDCNRWCPASRHPWTTSQDPHHDEYAIWRSANLSAQPLQILFDSPAKDQSRTRHSPLWLSTHPVSVPPYPRYAKGRPAPWPRSSFFFVASSCESAHVEATTGSDL